MFKTSRKTLFTFKLLLLTFLFSSQVQAVKIWTTGDSRNVSRSTSFTLCLAGGGNDSGYAGAWRRMINNAGGGDIVVIREDENYNGKPSTYRGYEDLIYYDDANMGIANVDSVTTILLERKSDADLTSVYNLVKDAEMVFFTGGNQWNYVNWIGGSRLEDAVHDLMNDNGVVAGTSAGMALLGGIDYTSRYLSPRPNADLVSSEDAINYPHVNENNPPVLDFNDRVINHSLMNNIITETHLDRRGKLRYGRSVALMAGATSEFTNVTWSNIKSIAAEEATAACLDRGGKAKVYGRGNVYFMQGNKPIERLQVGSSLDWWGSGEAVKVYSVPGTSNGNNYFDVSPWNSRRAGASLEYWYVDRGQFGGH